MDFGLKRWIACFVDLNAKGCVHQAFEMYRLKSCIDFKPYEGEKTYIKFEKRDGYDLYKLYNWSLTLKSVIIWRHPEKYANTIDTYDSEAVSLLFPVF